MKPEVVSRHLLRRRARKKALRLRHEDPLHRYYVRGAGRGPYRWYVIRR